MLIVLSYYLVLHKVLGVPADSSNSTCTLLAPKLASVWLTPPTVYQKALLTSELQEIFANAPLSAAAALQQSGLQKAWAEATGSPVKTAAENKGGQKRLPEEGDTCPIVS